MFEQKCFPGKIQSLQVLKAVDFGWYLNAYQLGEVLLPLKYAQDLQENDWVEVFVYFDSENRPIATTESPLAQVDEMAFMEIVDSARFGVFADWNLIKDLLIPNNQQHKNLEIGETALVKVLLDEQSNRLIGTTKIEPFLIPTPEDFDIQKPVTAKIYDITELGYKCVVNDLFSGLIYHNQLHGKKLFVGDILTVSVQQKRADGKLDLWAEKAGYDEKIEGITTDLLRILQNNDGFLPFNDKSDAEQIQLHLGMSKKNFKLAIGFLLKNNKIEWHQNGFRWKSISTGE